jgi:hypothetical protein
MTEFETEMQEVLIGLLTEFGWAGKLNNASTGELDRDTLEIVDSVNEDLDIRAIFFDPSTSNLTGYEQTLGKDYILAKKWMLVQVTSGSVGTGDVITSVDHGTFKVDKVTTIGPNNPIYYKAATDQVSGV